MKAVELIEVPNWHKVGDSNSFQIKKGEDLELVMKQYQFTDEEVKEITTRILKGNPHWVSLETKKETEELKKVQDEKEKEKKRKEELFLLKKNQQVDLLKKLGVKDRDMPHYE